MCTATLVNVHTSHYYTSHTIFKLNQKELQFWGTFFKSGCDVKVVIIFHFMGGAVISCATCWLQNVQLCSVLATQRPWVLWNSIGKSFPCWSFQHQFGSSSSADKNFGFTLIIIISVAPEFFLADKSQKFYKLFQK